MTSAKSLLMISALILSGSMIACGGPKSGAALKVESGLDSFTAAVNASGTDCKKMAAAVKAPALQIGTGMKELKANKESLPATTKVKFAGLTSTFQKMGDCAQSPEMQVVFQSLMAAAR